MEQIRNILRRVLVAWWCIPICWLLFWLLFGIEMASDFARQLWNGTAD